MNDNSSRLSAAARERKQAAFAMVADAQRARVRSGRRRAAILAGGACIAMGIVAGVLFRQQGPLPATAPVAAVGERVDEPRSREVARVAIVRDDAEALRRAKIDDTALRSLLAEAGESPGLVRVNGRVERESDVRLAAARAVQEPGVP